MLKKPTKHPKIINMSNFFYSSFYLFSKNDVNVYATVSIEKNTPTMISFKLSFLSLGSRIGSLHVNTINEEDIQKVVDQTGNCFIRLKKFASIIDLLVEIDYDLSALVLSLLSFMI
jgi:hypothetical protein